MNERQRKFCEHYAAEPNATAAVAAGYSPRPAYSCGQRMLKNAEIQKYLRELQDKAAAGRIATMTQTKAFWSDTMNNPAEKMTDRLKASELLAKAAGAFVHLPPHGDDAAFMGQSDGEDVVIYLPAIESEDAATWHDEQQKGGGVP